MKNKYDNLMDSLFNADPDSSLERGILYGLKNKRFQNIRSPLKLIYPLTLGAAAAMLLIVYFASGSYMPNKYMGSELVHNTRIISSQPNLAWYNNAKRQSEIKTSHINQFYKEITYENQYK